MIGRETIDDLGLTNVGDIVKQLPMNNAEVSATNTSQGSINGYVTDANIGAELANLRGLNVAFGTRTLTLIDGHRFVPSTNGGAVDLSLIPSNLVARTEVVTGGASAQYGSDAIAGVVNVILDKDLDGFKAQVDYGETGEGDGGDTHASFAWGTGFAEDRGHVLAGLEYQNQDRIGPCSQNRDWCREAWGIRNNSAGFAAGNGLPNFVVTTGAYAAAAESAGLSGLITTADPADLRAAVEGAAVPGDLREDIVSAYGRLGADVPVAVRSSATAEDLPGAAFAGQQDTYLNVVGADAVVDAVRRCWASLWTDRAVAYRRERAIDPAEVRIAVVVQVMIDSEVAGVMFTADPVSGARDRIVVDAGAGLGEAVVSGLVTPDHYVLDERGRVLSWTPGRGEVVVRSASGGGVVHDTSGEGGRRERLLSDDRLSVLVAHARTIAAHFGRPQDIEWADEQIEPLRSGDTAAFAVEGLDGDDDVVVLVHCRLADPAEMEELRRKIAEMSSMLKTLQHLARHCHGDERPDCPILDDLASQAP